ncbi:MAG: hypothetical protein LBO08_01275 [Rickettsiales bacterium]|jgi:hypothetical protein|nr:hypothetical protein [Rickettsiales bacterium]
MKKLSIEELIEKVDAAKKTNPLDLSSDQDLSIALMNLVSLEEHFFFSGGKTGKTGFYDLINTVREMRKDLMAKIVKKSTAENGEVWCISKHLLAASMRLMEVGTKALGAGKKDEATGLFNRAYELYSMFWGINMDLIDLSDVKMIEFQQGSECRVQSSDKKTKTSPDTKSGISKLGKWVRDKVNCCIE